MQTPNQVERHMVLRFGKALTQNPMKLSEERYPLWITLGYFDTLQLYPLPIDGKNENWIWSTCLEDRKISAQLDGNFYFHPVHIAACADEESQKRYKNFFSQLSPYLAVTFVQEQAVEKKNNTLLEVVKETLEQSPEKIEELTWASFHTLNLSDLVILWKSDSLGAILRAIKMLYQQPVIGDLHTIPAILLSSILKNAGAPSMKAERIPIVITRYLVRNTCRTGDFFQSISRFVQEKFFLTTGMEDLSTVSLDVDMAGLVSSLRARFEDQDVQDAFRAAFLESETHLGIEEESHNKEARDDLRLVQQCQILQNEFHSIRDTLVSKEANDTTDGDWIKAADELYNALVDMSRSTVSDGFCYLILESAHMFCEELRRISLPDSEQIMCIQRYLRGWGTLMEQSLRQDGKFSQQPGFSPALCQIPSSLLELYLAFNSKCCRVIRHITNDSYKFGFLLVPKLCRRIKVDIVILREPPCNRLLYVDIPSDLLYEPSLVLAHLCHELSHFCGESWRLREVRKNCYLCICAQELAYILTPYHMELKERIFQNLSSHFYSATAYLDRLEYDTLQKIESFLENEGEIEELLTAVIQSNGEDTTLSTYAQRVAALAARRGLLNALKENPDCPQGVFFNVMREFVTLFKECYADISMIFTLNLTCQQYLNLNKKEEMLYRRTLTQDSNDYYLTVERWAIVLWVAFPDRAHWALSQEIEKSETRFAEDVKKCLYYLIDDDKLQIEELAWAMEVFHHQESLYGLKDYLAQCYGEMQRSEVKGKDGLLNLREVFNSLAKKHDPFSDVCQNLVMEYRENLLHNSY